jgi:septal ring factor EnvC (AmiA/AmiB activator)
MMSLPRRRLVRPALAPPPAEPRDQRRILKLRSQLEHERAALARWQKRLRRAFTTVEKLQAKVARIERNISQLEGS